MEEKPTSTNQENLSIPENNIENHTPRPAFVAAETPQMAPVAFHANPIDIVIQWLTYAFWGWTAIAILVITSMVLTFYMQSADIASMLPYSIAAVSVLLPISIVCEILYRKREPAKKTGASSVIMIIHAVLFALCGVGALVTIVLNLVKLLISNSSLESTSSQVFLYAAIVMVVVYAVLFFRTIIPEKLFKFRIAVSGFMVLVSIVLIAVAAIGPITNEMKTKNDKLIENSLPYIVDAIEKYYAENNSLPATLNEVTLNGDVDKLKSEKLVTYINETDLSQTIDERYRYQLCANYVQADDTTYTNGPYGYPTETDAIYKYSPYVDTYGHAAGKVCYKLSVGNSYVYDSDTTKQ